MPFFHACGEPCVITPQKLFENLATEVDMNSSLVRPILAILLFASLFFFFNRTTFAGDEWREITPGELQMKSPKVDPDADAEAIFWEVRIDDSSDANLTIKHYVRVKIFTERGREKYSKFDVPFTKGTKIKDLQARIIQPDGTASEIGKNDIFEREIVKASGVKVKAKSFAVPNIAPGVIVEYRYTEAINDAGAKGMRLQFQRDIPVQTLSYYYKPYNKNEPHYQTYNFTDTKFVKDEKGFYLATRTNVPALNEEPRMPPEDMVRAWMLLTGARLTLTDASAFSISFVVKDPSDPICYWGAVATENAAITKFMNKSSKDIKAAAAEITAGAATSEEKLRKLYEFCQTQIKNTSFDPTLTDDERTKLPQIKSVDDVLKRKSASSQFVDMLFGALANASGLESRVVLTSDRSETFFDPNMTNEKLIHPGMIAVNADGSWKFFNPGVRFLPYGMLVWYEENNWSLLVGEKKYQWEKTPMTGYEKSLQKRSAKFTLLDDGTLEGDVRVEMSGQPALTYRLENYDESQTKREEDLKQAVKNRISTAEISAVSIENLEDSSKPLIESYKVRVPNYAQKTGKRLFLQPGFFEYGSNPLFSSASRKYDIYFHYPWSENDEIEIKLPAEFSLDSADAPGEIADPQKIGLVDVRMAINKADNLLKYKRTFHFGGGGSILFSAKMYQPLKNLFDSFNKADTHTVTLKQN